MPVRHDSNGNINRLLLAGKPSELSLLSLVLPLVSLSTQSSTNDTCLVSKCDCAYLHACSDVGECVGMCLQHVSDS